MLQKFTTCFVFLLGMGRLLAQTPDIVITEINYNPDGLDDIEFIELYNNGDMVNLEDYTLSGVTYTFPDVEFGAGEFILITENARTFESKFGRSAVEWTESNLGNGGEEIVLRDANGTTVDSVLYDDTDDWAQMPDGFGASLVICDVNAENSTPTNWQSSTNFLGRAGNRALYASPGALKTCLSEPFVYFTRFQRLTREAEADTVGHSIQMENPNGSPSSVSISIGPASTASPDDYQLLTPTVDFTGLSPELPFVDLIINNDDEVEGTEFVDLIITAESNIGAVYNSTARYYIYDDDTPLDEGIILIGVFSTQTVNSSQNEYGVELYALKNIADLSKYSVGVANNGDGSDGIEIPLPAVSVTAGDSYFISEDSTRFFDFFGFFPDFTHPSIWATGNDAIEVFENDRVIDTYGLIDVDGAGEPWEYEAGWAVRISEAGPDGTDFIPSDWIISGIGELTGVVNDSCLTPYPLGQFSHRNTETPVSAPALGQALDVRLSPNPVGDYLLLEYDSQAQAGPVEAAIYTTTGQLLRSGERSTELGQIRWNTSGLAPGIYLVQLRSAEGLEVLKFIKQ